MSCSRSCCPIRTQPDEWLEPAVFYVTAEAYDVGIFVVQWYPTRGYNATYYRHIRPASKQHIVIWFTRGHFEAVQYNNERVFATDHPFVERLRQLCTSHVAPESEEVDVDQLILGERLLARPVAAKPRKLRHRLRP